MSTEKINNGRNKDRAYFSGDTNLSKTTSHYTQRNTMKAKNNKMKREYINKTQRHTISGKSKDPKSSIKDQSKQSSRRAIVKLNQSMGNDSDIKELIHKVNKTTKNFDKPKKRQNSPKTPYEYRSSFRKAYTTTLSGSKERKINTARSIKEYGIMSKRPDVLKRSFQGSENAKIDSQPTIGLLTQKQVDQYVSLLPTYIKYKEDSKTVETLQKLLDHFLYTTSSPKAPKRHNFTRAVTNRSTILTSARNRAKSYKAQKSEIKNTGEPLFVSDNLRKTFQLKDRDNSIQRYEKKYNNTSTSINNRKM